MEIVFVVLGVRRFSKLALQLPLFSSGRSSQDSLTTTLKYPHMKTNYSFEKRNHSFVRRYKSIKAELEVIVQVA